MCSVATSFLVGYRDHALLVLMYQSGQTGKYSRPMSSNVNGSRALRFEFPSQQTLDERFWQIAKLFFDSAVALELSFIARGTFLSLS